jgi:uncharacterized membrane protein YedE/YeeE
VIRLAAFLAGLLFALGLGLAGMTRPERVLAFLEWRDPGLVLTMAGAVAVTFVGFPRVLRRERPLLAPRFFLPTRRDLDARLLAGAAVFGVGWGLTGLCPGPALTDLVGGGPQIFLFVAAMVAGMSLHRLLFERTSP